MFAYAGLLGMDVEAMISGSPSDYRMRVHIVQRALELRRRLDEEAAIAIVNKLAEGMKKGASS